MSSLSLIVKKDCNNTVCPISLQEIYRIDESNLVKLSDNNCYRIDSIQPYILLKIGQIEDSGRSIYNNPDFILPTRSPINNDDLIKLGIPPVDMYGFLNIYSPRRSPEYNPGGFKSLYDITGKPLVTRSQFEINKEKKILSEIKDIINLIPRSRGIVPGIHISREDVIEIIQELTNYGLITPELEIVPLSTYFKYLKYDDSVLNFEKIYNSKINVIIKKYLDGSKPRRKIKKRKTVSKRRKKSKKKRS